ncbi:MAG TPA: hypothetical protein VJ954_06315 [Ignavibacteriaceae bacterium]|nr:hypothetical protein [Ignavibacteriaceae bacterium]
MNAGVSLNKTDFSNLITEINLLEHESSNRYVGIFYSSPGAVIIDNQLI